MKIYCLGDSLTTGYGVSGSDCWVRRVAAKTGFEMINAGLNGDVTLGMAARFYRDTESMHPDLMFLLGGGNDRQYYGYAGNTFLSARTSGGGRNIKKTA